VNDVANLFNDISARKQKEDGKGKRRAQDDTNLITKANRALDMDDEDDMADFIEDDSPDEDDRRNNGKKTARKIKEKQRKKQRAARGFAMAGMDITAE